MVPKPEEVLGPQRKAGGGRLQSSSGDEDTLALSKTNLPLECLVPLPGPMLVGKMRVG